jgi:hypothetical protein
VSQSIVIRGGHLPRYSLVDLIWTSPGASVPLRSTAETSAKGSFTARLAVPAAPFGVYHVLARVNRRILARAPYRIYSRAHLSISVVLSAAGDILRVTGSHFVPGSHVRFLVYSVGGSRKPLTLKRMQTDASGHVAFSVSRSLHPGEYELHALSNDTLVVDMAQTYFAIVI